MSIALVAVITIAAMLLTGFFHQSVRRFILGFLARPCQMAMAARDAFWRWSRQTGEWIGTVRQAEGMAAPADFVQRSVGAVCYITFLAVFLLNETHVGLLTWSPALGLAGGSLEKWLPASAIGIVMATGVVFAGILAALIATDVAGKTNLAPWNRIRSTRMLRVALIFYGFLILAVVIALAQHRIDGLQSMSIQTAAPAGESTVDTVDQVATRNEDSISLSNLQASSTRDISEQVMLTGHAVLMLISASAAGWGLIGAPMITLLLLAQVFRGVCQILSWPFTFVDLVINWVGQAILNLYDFITRACLLLARPIAQRFFPGVTDVDLPVGDINPQVTPAAIAIADTGPQVQPHLGDPFSPPPSDGPAAGTGGHIIDITPEPAAPSSNWKPY